MRTIFGDPRVEAIFNAYPAVLRAPMLELRDLILTTAAQIPDTGNLIETLKWGGSQAIVTSNSGREARLRIDAFRGSRQDYAVFFHCQTTLVSTFREPYPDQLTFEGNRAIVFSVERPVPREPSRHCLALALTYRRRT